MAVKPFLIFGGQGAPKGGAADYLEAHFTKDEAVQRLADLHLAWWSLVVYNDDGLILLEESKRKGKASEKELEQR